MAQKTGAPQTELDELNAHIPALVQLDKQLLAELLALEKAGIKPEEPRPGTLKLTDRVAHYMNGFSSAHLVAGNRGERRTPSTSTGRRLNGRSRS